LTIYEEYEKMIKGVLKIFMEIKQYNNEYFEETFEVVHKTIEEIYPKYYPRKAVDFFHEHHSKENMKTKLPQECVLVLFENGNLIGTGTLVKNDISRFFILPECQRKGYGKKLYNKLTLDSSLGAIDFYKNNKYKYSEYKIIDLPDGYYLCYMEMEKEIK
jgi:GNAT superfamily N-acetyltransferase